MGVVCRRSIVSVQKPFVVLKVDGCSLNVYYIDGGVCKTSNLMKQVDLQCNISKHWYLSNGEKGKDWGKEMNQNDIKGRRATENNNQIVFLSFAFMLQIRIYEIATPLANRLAKP